MADGQLLAKAIAKATKEFNQEYKGSKIGPAYEGGLTTTLRMLEKRSDEWLRQCIQNSAPYSNGRAKAETYLNQKMQDAGVRVENANNQFVIRETSKGFDVLLKGEVVFQSYNREEAEGWARNNKRTPFGYDESSAPK